MKRFLPILNMLPVILIIFYLLAYIKLDTSLEKRYKAAYTESITNNASDAAVAALTTDTVNLGQDYTNYSEIEIDPEVGKYAFGMTLALAENMQPTKSTAEECLMEHIKILTVCADDGYYIYQAIPTHKDPETKTTVYEIGGTPKMPYTYKASNGKLYALRLNGNKTLCLDGESAYEVDTDLGYLPQKESKYEYVNRLISEEINGRVKELYTQGWKNNVYIPATLGNLTATNPIEGITVMALVDGYGGNQSFGIGGTKLENRIYYVGFKDATTEKLYYIKSREGLEDSSVKVFNTALEAAKAGYYCKLE